MQTTVKNLVLDWIFQLVCQYLKKMLPGEWLNWRRKDISTPITAQALSVFLNYVENNRFADYEAFHSPKIVVQLFEASYKYYIPELWKDVSDKILLANDAYFRDTTIEMLAVVIRVHPRPNLKAIAKKLLELLATYVKYYSILPLAR